MPGKVTEALYPAMTWPQRAAAWKQRERDLLLDIKALGEQLDEEYALREAAEAEARRLKTELVRARKQIRELSAAHAVQGENPSSDESASSDGARGSKLPPWVKANVAKKPRRKPGRKKGHPAALRPMPEKIDQKIEVPLATDGRGRALCPHCRGVLMKLLRHARLVEDLTPSNLEVTQFNTRSGYCINCERRVESRAAHQPPAADVPHGQIGLNALALGVMLRVRHRLPFRQITQVFVKMA